jgi:hypothetical protein
MDKFDFKDLRESFTYCPNKGTLIRNSNGNAMKGTDAYGYVQVGYRGKMYKAHRLIWVIMHNEFPNGQIDHINGVRHDNRACNLRVVTRQQNAHNKQNRAINNKSGYTGVCWNKKVSKWQASISVNRVNIYLGIFTTPELAQEAYLVAKKIYHPSAPVN